MSDNNPFGEDLVKAFITTQEQFDGYLQLSKQNVERLLAKGKIRNAIPNLTVWHRAFPTYERPEQPIESTLIVMAVGFNENDDGGKRTLLKAIGHKFWERKQIPVAATLFCEAWMSALPLNTRLQDVTTPPSKMPNRREMLIVFAMSLDQRMAMSMSPILRDRKNRIHPTCRWVDSKSGEARCQLVEAFYEGFFIETRRRANQQPPTDPSSMSQ